MARRRRAASARARTRIDDFMPVWQFNEVHSVEVAVPPARAFAAMKAVTADEIFLFRALTWIRRGGRPMAECILRPGSSPLLDVATRTGFLELLDDPPRELVIGTILINPANAQVPLTPTAFRDRLPPGVALATMNFLIAPGDSGGSIVSTETRVYANSTRARRRFALYWAVIRPGSAFLRRMWLRAIRRRALTAAG